MALPRPDFLTDGRHYYWFELAVLMALIAFVCMFRTRRTGRNLAAVRESEAAALAVGINLTRAKLTAFAVSAFIAGVGGVLYAGLSGVASPDSFSPFTSISLLAVSVIGGLGSAAGAVLAGLFQTVGPQLIRDYLPFGKNGDLPGVIFGAGLVVQLLRAPLGIASQVLAAERRIAAMVRTALRRNQPSPVGAEVTT